MPLLHCKSLSLAFGDVALLDHVDLAIENRERIALIGRNGTGKTSLMSLLTGRSAPDDGEVVRESGLRVASVAQEPQFTPGMRVSDAVALGYSLIGDDHTEAWQQEINVVALLARLGPEGVQEVILATNPSLEGEATALYVQRQLAGGAVRVTRIARGLPVGGDLEYADGVTIAQALAARREML